MRDEGLLCGTEEGGADERDLDGKGEGELVCVHNVDYKESRSYTEQGNTLR